MKKILAFVLAVLCVLPVFAGCTDYADKMTSVAGAKKNLVGSWTFAEDPECGEYLVFKDNGDVIYTIGSFKYYGTYTLKKVTVDNGSYIALDSDFSIFSQENSDVTLEFSEDNNKITLGFVNETLELVRKELPAFDIEPENITHASADELEAKTLNVDKAVLGGWTLEIVGYAGTYETYTFKEDGTCLYKTDYIAAMGYGMEIEFKYTTKDGKMLLTQKMFNGTTSDLVFDYKVEDSKFVVEASGNTLTYSPVK